MSFLTPRRAHVVCSDGYTISIQAGASLYCESGGTAYLSVELGFPNARDSLIERYIEDPSVELCLKTGRYRTVYGYVPASTVIALIKSHGGIVSGDLPTLEIPGTSPSQIVKTSDLMGASQC